jgi:hypothetical protein
VTQKALSACSLGKRPLYITDGQYKKLIVISFLSFRLCGCIIREKEYWTWTARKTDEYHHHHHHHHRLYSPGWALASSWGLVTIFFLRGGVVSLTPNPQPGGPGYAFLPGSSPLTCLAWETLSVAYATTSIALGIIWPHKPRHYAKVGIPSGGRHDHRIHIIMTDKFTSYIITPAVNI